METIESATFFYLLHCIQFNLIGDIQFDPKYPMSDFALCVKFLFIRGEIRTVHFDFNPVEIARVDLFELNYLAFIIFSEIFIF